MKERNLLNSQIDSIKKQIQTLELESEQMLLSHKKLSEREIMFTEFKELTREMVDNFVESIIIYNGGRMEINLKYSDEFIELQDVNNV